MSDLVVKTRIVLRNDTKSSLEASTVVLLKGEVALELDNEKKTAKFKVGDGIATYAQLPYSTLTPDEINTAINEAITNTTTVGSISLSSGTTNGTVKLTVDGTTFDNIAVTGLGSAAYTDITDYATAAQGTKADNAMPKSGGAFTGTITLADAPTTDLGAATKKYVDDQIANKIAESDAMVYRGTIGNDGNVTTLPTTNVVTGDTYKVISELTIDATHTAKIGDIIIANVNEKTKAIVWDLIPSGDEIVTTVSIATTGVTVNSTAQAGSIVLGTAAAKQVAVDVVSNTENLVTAAQVKSYVESLGYSTSDEKVKTTPVSAKKVYLAGTESKTETTGTAKINTGVFINTSNKVESTAGFKGDVDGTASKAAELVTGIKTTLSGGVEGTSDPVTATAVSNDIVVTVTSVNTDYLVNGEKTLILDGGSATETSNINDEEDDVPND